MELPKAGEVLLEKYRLERLLGEGGMGVVYAAHHELLGQRVAVKLIRPEFAAQGDAVTRFLNEARAAARIENDHVARVLDVGMIDGKLPYMVLEYLDGADLAHVLHERRVIPVPDVVDYMLQTIEAVAHAHAQGIVHRDLKPSNLFLARKPDGTSRVKVLDFGISKALGAAPGGPANVTRTNAMLGSPLYMSPEQLRDSKGVDQRCDIWALGVICYELLTGQPPFNGENAVALFAAIMESAPPSLAKLRGDAAPLEPAVMRCLRNRADERFPSVTDLGQALAPFGTATAARALDNAKRILPPTSARSLEVAATLALAPPPSSPALMTPYGQQRPPAIANTADPWASSRAAMPTGKTSPIVFVAIAGALAVGLGAFGVWRMGAHAAAVDAGAPALAASSPTIAVASASAAPSTAESSPPPATVSAEPPPAVSATATPTKPIAVKPAPAVPAVKPTAAAPSASANKAANCNPPYYYDATGKKIWKRECE